MIIGIILSGVFIMAVFYAHLFIRKQGLED